MSSPLKVISFSLYGRNRDYYLGALANLELYARLLPDYTPVMYVGDSIPPNQLYNLKCAGAELKAMSGFREDWNATMWRFRALQMDAERVIFRDLDSRPGQREVAAVRAWEASNKGIHVMRDHPAHMATVLAGMWGCTREIADRLSDKIPDFSRLRPSNDYHEHVDQAWLEVNVWPMVAVHGLQHCSFWTKWYGRTEPFPTERVGNEFVGKAFKADGSSRYPEHDHIESLCSRCKCSINCERREA